MIDEYRNLIQLQFKKSLTKKVEFQTLHLKWQ